MKFPFFNKKQTIVAVDAMEEGKKNESFEINERLNLLPIDRIRETLKDWKYAVEDAENPLMQENIKYHSLLNLYANIELDEHVKALTKTILYSVTQTPFAIFTNGEINEEKTNLFKKSWFFDFMQYYLEAQNYGFSLVQFEGIENGTFKECEQIDRYHVRPHGEYVSIDRYQNTKDFDLEESPLKEWTLLIKSEDALGLFNTIAKRFILKREVVQFWAIYNELFTAPFFTVKTDFNNSKHRNDLLNMLESRKHSGFAVVGVDDEISMLTNGGAGYTSYKDFENQANQAMSKAFLGQTMVFEDGSSNAQAEVHERQKNIFIAAKRVKLAYVINEKLIPKMNK